MKTTISDLSKLLLRQATSDDLFDIVRLMSQDELGALRETLKVPLDACYTQAFQRIHEDKNQALFVVTYGEKVIGTYQLSLMTHLTFKGARRLNIETVHVDAPYQTKGVGTWMIEQALVYARHHGCTIVQLTTNKKRVRSKAFYERLGFRPTHEGMKLHL